MPDERLNILCLSSWYPSDEHPTLGNFVERHCRAVSLYHKASLVYATASSTNRIEVKQKGQLSEIIVYYKKKLPLLSYLKALRKAFSTAQKLNGKFDLLHLHVAYPAGLFALMLRLPYVITEHFTAYLPTSKFKWSLWQKTTTKTILRKAKILLPVSQNLGIALLKFSSVSNFRKISNVVDTSVFYPDTKPQVFTFLHVSTLNEETKNISGLLDAIALLQKDEVSFRLLIGGDGNIEKLRASIEARKLDTSQIEVFGEKTSTEIAALMKRSNCFVLSSHIENQPCVILEALCSGLTIISTNVGGIKEEVNETNGVLTEPHNTEELYEAMKKMMHSYSYYNLDEIARKARESYSNEAVGKQLSDIYLNVLSKGS